MTALLTALGSGISAKKILEYIMRQAPELSPKISSAVASGLSAEKIVGFFSKDRNFEKLKSKMQKDYQLENNANPLVQSENIRGMNLGSDMASGLQRAAPVIAGGAITAFGLKKALKHALPNLLKGPELEETQPQQATSLEQPPVNVSPNIPQPVNPVQPKGISNPREYLEKAGLKEKVDALLKAGNPPEAIAAALNIGTKGKKATGEIDPELLSAIDAYAKTTQNQPQEQPSMESPSAKLDEIQPKIERPTIAKNETVASPHGIGEIKEIRNGQAIIDVDGKLHKVKEEELEASPLPKKDLADLYDDLKGGIENATDEDMSRMVDYAGYDPGKNTLAFLPYTGGLYVYEDISPEDASLLRNVLNVRKTSGENFIGVWKKDSKSPIGSAMSALIKKLQSERGGKGKEYSHKFETVYKSTEPAIIASKKKKAEAERKKKEEEKRKKKNAKT